MDAADRDDREQLEGDDVYTIPHYGMRLGAYFKLTWIGVFT